MLINRFFKSTLGVGAEALVVNTLDTSAGGGTIPAKSPTGTVTVTIAATPTLGDELVIDVEGEQYEYTVGAGDTTAAILHTSILTMLNANTQGFTATGTGTTSSVYTLTGPSGAAWNGYLISATADTNTGPTFSAISSTNFAGGVNGQTGAAQPNYQDFCANAVAGSLGIFFNDNNFNGNGIQSPAVPVGGTSTFANRRRQIFYGYKMADGTVKRTSPIPVEDLSYNSVTYTAGQPDIVTVTFGGTYTAGQGIMVRITNRTVEAVPYPTYEYWVTSTGTIATDVAALAAAINAEYADPVVTATAAADVLTITGIYNQNSIVVTATLNTTLQAETDQSAIVIGVTQASIAPIGTNADVLEFETYFQVILGETLYTQAGVLPSEMGLPASNVSSAVQYGYLIVKSRKRDDGVTRNYNNKSYCVIAIASTLLATLQTY